MDTKGSQVGFNREYSGLQLRYNALKEQVANQIEILNNQVNVVGPNIRSRYMMLVGQFEYRIYELDADIARWKRRFTLRQAALNMGEKPDYLAIERQLDEEFAEYLAKIEANVKEIKSASLLYHSRKMGDSDYTDFRVLYLDAVKLLHPDLNPNLPQAAKDLWNEITKAYEARDWAQVKYLAGLAKEVAEGERAFDSSADGMRLLSIPQFEVNRLELASALEISSERLDSFVLLSCISGAASVQMDVLGQTAMFPFTAGQTVLVPCECTTFRLVPSARGTVILETTIPPVQVADPYINPAAEESLDDEDES